jgi:hypothetical protein
MSDVHIHRVPGKYLGQVRDRGCRRWRTVTRYCQTAEAAMVKTILRMNGATRARVLWVDAGDGWYEPHVAMEASR